jgi:indole-3-glycerol phosphate synthase
MLDAIIAAVRARLASLVEDADDLRDRAEGAAPTRDFGRALSGDGLAVIAEVKRRSPSRGPIDEGLDAPDLALRYAIGGAAAISVLTEPEFFAGSPDDLAAVRSSVDVPVLRKDFIVHPAQVWETRAMGADAVLFIVAALDDVELIGLIDTAAEAGLAALVEVHTAAEAERAVWAGARIVGVNNRDLESFEVDLSTAEKLREKLPEDVVAVAESGVSSPAGARRMAAAGYDAVLVGEAAVRAADPAQFVRSLLEGA